MAKKEELGTEEAITDKEEAFCQHYVVSWNGTQAVVDAGFSKNRNSAGVTAYRLLRIAKIRARIKELMQEKLMEEHEVLARLADMARSNMAELVELVDEPIVLNKKRIGVRQVARLKPDAFARYGHLIKSISPAKGGGYRIELYSAKEALELIGKHYSTFIDKDKEGNPIRPVVNIYMPDNNRT